MWWRRARVNVEHWAVFRTRSLKVSRHRETLDLEGFQARDVFQTEFESPPQGLSEISRSPSTSSYAIWHVILIVPSILNSVHWEILAIWRWSASVFLQVNWYGEFHLTWGQKIHMSQVVKELREFSTTIWVKFHKGEIPSAMHGEIIHHAFTL